MPVISKRGEKVPMSPFRKLIPYADAAKKRGIHVYHLNIGQPDIETPQYALEAVRNTDFKVLAYSPAVGTLSYRSRLAHYYERYKVAISPEDIIVTTGASEGIQLAMLACLNQGDEVIVPEPFYANYNGFAQIADVQIKPITCHIEDGFALPDLSAFEASITPKTKAIIITNPNNPTGCFYSEVALKGLASLIKKYDLFLFVDEVYRDFCYDGNVFYSALRLEGVENHVVVMDSISKRYSACGARIGAVITRNKSIITSLTRYAKLRLSPPGLGQILAEEILSKDEAYLEAVAEEYDKRRKVVYNRLRNMEHVVSYLPGGAFYCFARFPLESAEHFCKWLLEFFDYKGATLMLSPGEGFYATPGLGKDEVRIAYVLKSEDLNAAMDCLEEALKVYPGIVRTYNEPTTLVQ
jgi:aspartate aminotransferase